MFHKDKDYLSLMLSEETFKVVHVRVSAAEKKVLQVAAKDVRGVADEELPKLIRAASAGINARKPVVLCALPLSVVTTKNIEIPSLDPAEIKSIIDLQAGRHTPFSREEILIGYVTIGVFQRNYTQILLIIVNRAVIKRQLDILDQSGFKIDRVCFAPETLAVFYARALGVQEGETPVGIIDVSRQSTDFIMEFNKTVATCRSIPIGMGHLLADPGAGVKLIDEVAQSLEAYKNEDINKMPETFLLTSDDSKVKELQAPLQARLKASVKVMPYLDFIQGSQSVMLKLVSEYNDDSFLSLIAAAAESGEARVDLTPEEIVVQRSIEEKSRQAIKACLLAIVILFLVAAVMISKIYFKSAYLERVKKYHRDLKRKVIVLDRLSQKTRIIKDYLRSRMVGLDTINELYRLVPDEIYLEDIALDEKGTISIRGISESMSRVFNMVTALEESPLFKSVKTSSTTAKKDRGKDVAAFEISFKLETAKDEPEEEEAEAVDPAEAKNKDEKPAKEKSDKEKPAEKK